MNLKNTKDSKNSSALTFKKVNNQGYNNSPEKLGESSLNQLMNE